MINKVKFYTGKAEQFTVNDIDSDLFGTPLTTDIMEEPIDTGADIWRAGAHLVPVSHIVKKI